MAVGFRGERFQSSLKGHRILFHIMGGKQRKKRHPLSFQQRFYRSELATGTLRAMEVRVDQSDLQIMAERDVRREARDLLLACRSQLEQYIRHHPDFMTSLTPLADDRLAPAVVRQMLAAGQGAGVGPMAAVAGAVAEYVGRGLLKLEGVAEVMVENGGDIFLARRAPSLCAIYAGDSPLSGTVGLRIPAEKMPLGICTSSGTIGHSLSFGVADSVTVLAPDCAVADAAATALANVVKKDNDMNHALEQAKKVAHIIGVVIICNEQLGAWGEVELTRLAG